MKAAHRILLCSLLSALLALSFSAAASQAASPEAGSVKFTRAAESDFDQFTKDPTAGEQESMRNRFWRMRTYAPYFDARLSWYKDAWTYKNLYAIYSDDAEAEAHSDQILKDANGNRLYIPFDCDGQKCTQYAGDFGDPAFRARWIAAAKEQSANYRGIFIDDVNMEVRVGNAKGEKVMPQDPRTGRTMTEADYRRYIAEFTEQIKAALPGKEIVHNALWFADHSDPSVRRELDAATHIELERGVNDDGLRGGNGQWSYERFMKRVDYLHSRGKGVIFDSGADNEADVEYELASYFLVSGGNDGVGTPWRSNPRDWWQGYDVELGAPRGNRYEWNGMLRRDFANGYVLVNQPDSPTRSARLPAGSRGPAGDPRGAVRLGAGQGKIVLGRVPAAVGRPVLKVTTNPLTRLRARSSRTSRPVIRRARRTAKLRGRVKRATGGKVRVTVQRRVRGGWRASRTVVTRVSKSGTFNRTFRSLPRGGYRIKATYGGQKSATSVRHFRIRR
ncbi:MAG TPA: putative glycoside hydrolase [Thermoleophilaceae bacterium]|nr:putative glycoside hydrolase [Thermoleophilaceae bacterium]